MAGTARLNHSIWYLGWNSSLLLWPTSLQVWCPFIYILDLRHTSRSHMTTRFHEKYVYEYGVRLWQDTSMTPKRYCHWSVMPKTLGVAPHHITSYRHRIYSSLSLLKWYSNMSQIWNSWYDTTDGLPIQWSLYTTGNYMHIYVLVYNYKGKR